jgi:hypothetical protein
MAFGDCCGESLPYDGKEVNCAESVSSIEDCCDWIEIADEVMLCESVTGKKGKQCYYYWVFLEADECRLMVCALEKYADSQGVKWQGRRSDYLTIGWYESICYVVIIEIRHVLLKEKQMEKISTST